MSIGNSHLDDNVHRKRQRTASQDSIERRSAKKARAGPHHQFSLGTINPNATSFPRQSTTRRAATDNGHNTKQVLLNFRTSEECHSLPHSPLPSANSPQHLPLTEESLRLLNNRCLPQVLRSLNAQHPMQASTRRLRTKLSTRTIPYMLMHLCIDKSASPTSFGMGGRLDSRNCGQYFLLPGRVPSQMKPV